jgi:hypothetical protein
MGTSLNPGAKSAGFNSKSWLRRSANDTRTDWFNRKERKEHKKGKETRRARIFTKIVVRGGAAQRDAGAAESLDEIG